MQGARFLLISWWWGKSGVSEIFIIHLLIPVFWGLHTCGLHDVTTLQAGKGILVLLNNSKICIRLLCISFEEELGLSFITELLFKLLLLFLFALPLFLYALTSLVNYLCPLFGTQGRPRRLKPFATNKKQRTRRGFGTWEGPAGFCSVSIPPFLWHSSILRRTGARQERE